MTYDDLQKANVIAIEKIIKLENKLQCISRSIEKWCMDDHPDNVIQEELTPSLETIYNISIGSLDNGLDVMIRELDSWDKYKEIIEY